PALLLRALGLFDGLADALAPVGEGLLEHRLVDRGLRREVVEQAGAPDADAGGDVVERGPLVAALGEAATGLLEDRRACRAGTTLVRHRAEGTGRSADAVGRADRGGRAAGRPVGWAHGHRRGPLHRGHADEAGLRGRAGP